LKSLLKIFAVQAFSIKKTLGMVSYGLGDGDQSVKTPALE